MKLSRPFAIGSVITATLATIALGQYTLQDNEITFLGGGFYNSSDHRLANYTSVDTPPFNATLYEGYYTWSLNNNTVGIQNATAYADQPLGLSSLPYGGDQTFPLFVVNEGKPKEISFREKSCCLPFKFGIPCGEGRFNKVLHILFENENFDWTMSNTYWKTLAKRGKLLTNSHGITHPSAPNYIAMVGGDFFGISGEKFYIVNATSIYDLLDAEGIDYATYVEWYDSVQTERGPNDCNQELFLGPLDGTDIPNAAPTYRRVDVPALWFSTYTQSYERCSKIHNATAKFQDDVFNGSLPSYSYYISDMLHNSHDPQSDDVNNNWPSGGGMWLNAFLDVYLEELINQGTLIVATFDEATSPSGDDYVPNNNSQIATLLFGYGVTPNTEDDTYFAHYGLLRGAISNFGLGSLGRNDTNSTNGDLSSFVW